MKSLYISLALLLFFGLNMQAKTTKVDYDKMDGSSVDKCFGAAQPSSLKFKNTSKQRIYDFAFSLSHRDGTPINFNITQVQVKEGNNAKGFVPMAGGNGVYRIGAKDANGNYVDAEAVASGKEFTLDITLSQAPNKPWCVNIQPTDKNSRSIAATTVAFGFGQQAVYALDMNADMAMSGLFPGVSFADINASGYPIDTFIITSPSNQIFNPVFLGPLGDTLQQPFYDPTSGVLVPQQPVLPGESFHIAFLINQFLSGGPMLFDLQAILPGPLKEAFFDVPAVGRIDHAGQITTTGIFAYEYFIPLHEPEPFLQIFAQAQGSTGPPVWVGQNLTLEYFEDTMQVDLFHELDGLLPVSATGIDIAWIVTDTVMEFIPILPSFLFQPYPVQTVFSDYAPVLIPANEIPNTPILRTGIRQWENELSRGVLIGCNMPNFDLDSSRYRANGLPKPHVPDDYAGDWNACGPVATTNSFSWLRKIHPDVDQKLGAAFGQGDTAMRKMLAEFSKLMGRFDEDPVYITDFIKAKLAFIDKHKLPIRVSWQSMHRKDSTLKSPNKDHGHKADRDKPAAKPGQSAAGITPEFLLKALQDSCDTEILFTWKKVDAMGNVTYPNGHYVTLTGIRNRGDNWDIKWKDDKDQSKQGGTRQGISPMEVDSASGMVRVPGLDNDTWGKCFISNVAIECYDPTIKFKAVKGRAFRDPAGSGSSTGKKGAGGLTVNLVDALTGTILESTITLPDGAFFLNQIPDPQAPMYVEFILPPGIQLVPQNLGTNDSIDSDFDPINARSDVFIFPFDTTFIFDAGLQIPGLDVVLWPEGLYDPLTGLLGNDFWQNGLLPVHDPFPGMGFPVLPIWPDSILPAAQRLEGEFDSLWLDNTYFTDPVDWVCLSLWDSINAPQPILSVSMLLLPNGHLVTPNYEPLDLFLLPLPAGLNAAHVSIWTPGHLGLISADPLPLLLPLQPAGFNDPLFLVAPGMDRIQLSTQAVLLPMGETNADGVIDAADRAATWNTRNTSGYRLDDVNRDGVVDAADRAATWNNRNLQGHQPR